MERGAWLRYRIGYSLRSRIGVDLDLRWASRGRSLSHGRGPVAVPGSEKGRCLPSLSKFDVDFWKLAVVLMVTWGQDRRQFPPPVSDLAPYSPHVS